MSRRIPHLRVVLAVTAFALAGFSAVSAWVLLHSDDLTNQGLIIGVWVSAATGAFAFWLGSSSGGKAQPPDSEGEP